MGEKQQLPFIPGKRGGRPGGWQLFLHSTARWWLPEEPLPLSHVGAIGFWLPEIHSLLGFLKASRFFLGLHFPSL